MTPNEARDFADNLQERVNQMGERTGEGFHLGACLSVIRGLASQIDALTPAPAADVPIAAAPPEKPRKKAKSDSPVPFTDPLAADNTPPRLDE